MSELPLVFLTDEPTPASAEFDARAEPGLVRLHGALDCVTSPTLERALAGVECVHGRIIIDLQGLRFLGAAGIAVIVHAARTLGDIGRIVLWRPQPNIARTIRITGLERWLELPKRRRYRSHMAEQTA